MTKNDQKWSEMVKNDKYCHKFEQMVEYSPTRQRMTKNGQNLDIWTKMTMKMTVI